LTGSERPVRVRSVDGKWYTVDSIGLTGAGTGTFSSRHTGNGRSVTVSGVSLDWQWVQRLMS